MMLSQRVIDKIDASGDCWEWTGCTRRGYGISRVGTKSEQAHRVVWESLVGPIPEGLEIDHLCRNSRCVNPDHLEPVTHGENLRRGFSHWRNRRECPEGHPYSGENLAMYGGNRSCRACHRKQTRESMRRHRALKRGD